MSKLVERECPNCAAAIKFNEELQVIKCEYCDTEFESPVLKSNDNKTFNTSKISEIYEISNIYKSIIIPSTYQNIKQKFFSILKKVIFIIVIFVVISIVLIILLFKYIMNNFFLFQ